ncbi:hypothetical protein [Ruegeria atlantica]|uniref:hypothetical protein n=1 Tax=Ruegeria atlantica TaxID=81569 RepID=UPI00147D1D1E|nr:hypothetical protein [Ruegeria atlantica]
MTGRICDRQGLFETSGNAGGSCTIRSSHQEPCVMGNYGWIGRCGAVDGPNAHAAALFHGHMRVERSNVKLSGRVFYVLYDGVA